MTPEETIDSFWHTMEHQHTELTRQRAEIRQLRSLLAHYQQTTDNESKVIADLMMENAQLRLRLMEKE